MPRKVKVATDGMGVLVTQCKCFNTRVLYLEYVYQKRKNKSIQQQKTVLQTHINEQRAALNRQTVNVQ